MNQPIEHFGSGEIRLTAVATESYKVGVSGLLKAPEIAGHEMNLHRLGTGGKVLPRLAPKTGARSWGTRLLTHALQRRWGDTMWVGSPRRICDLTGSLGSDLILRVAPKDPPECDVGCSRVPALGTLRIFP